MQLVVRRILVLLFGMAVCSLPCSLHAQEARTNLSPALASASSLPALPDAPEPRITADRLDDQAAQAQTQQSPAPAPATAPQSQDAQSQDAQSHDAPQPAPGSSSPAPSTSPTPQNGAAQGNSSSSAQNAPQQPATPETQHQKAEEQIKEQEHQRIAGILPSFNVTYHSDAVSLTSAEKFKLQFRSSIDPYTFAIAAITAGLGEAEDSNTGFGWGPSGYAERWAAAYGDNVIGNTIGNAILPSILHQDPRYFRLGHGTIVHRMLYSAATSFICKHDNTGKWEPNYSNVLGNMIAGEISTLYYPNSKSDGIQAVETGLTVTFEGTFGAELQEFWPDISRKFFHKDPTHGLDAQLAAHDKRKSTNSNDPPPISPASPAPTPAAKAL
jgi:hypothetical protein